MALTIKESVVAELVLDIYSHLKGIDQDDLSKAEKNIINILHDFQEEHLPNSNDPIPSCNMSEKSDKVCPRCDERLHYSEMKCNNCGTKYYQ